MIDYSILLEKGITFCQTEDSAIRELWRLRGTGTRFGIDTETKTMDPFTGRLRLVQIADINENVGVFDTWKIGDKALQVLADFIANPDFLKIAHNAKYDLKFLRYHLKIKEIYPVICTMIEASLLACGNKTISVSLQSVIQEYLGIIITKEEQLSDWGLDKLTLNQIEYAALDAKYLIRLHRQMFSYIRKSGMEQTLRLEMNCVGVTAEMELNGMPINFDAWCKRADEDKRLAKEEQLKIYELLDSVKKQDNLFGEPASFNINSPIQLKEKFKLAGIPIPTIEERDGRVRETTSKDQLKEIEHLHPVIPHIIQQRILHKAYTTYGRNWKDCINKVTGRIHANYNQNGTETGRYSTGLEVSDHFDPPMLGIPREEKYRNCFEVDEGKSLVWGDYSQIELRILADFANDKNLLQAFIDDRDPHLDAAERLFGIPQSEVTKEQRHLAKDLNYAIPYGVAPPKFALKAHITEEESKILIEKYFSIYPGIKSWLESAGWNAIKRKQCRTASGRLLKFHYDESNKRSVSMARRNGKNAPIQGTCSDIIKLALFKTYRAISETKIKIYHVFHDEIIVECNNEDVEIAKGILNQCMVDSGKEFLKRVPIKVDVKSGKCWGK